MNHDIEDLLNLIKMLEERIMVLELSSPYRKVRSDDDWYWEHG